MKNNSFADIHELIKKAEEFEISGDWLKAAATYQQVLHISPLEAMVWHRVGVCLCQAGSHKDAIQFLDKASMLAPNTIEYEMALGDALFSVNRLDEAINAYLKVQELDPKDASATNNIGIALQEAGLMEDAINAIRHAMTLSPRDPLVEANLGAALLKVAQIDQAIIHLEAALQRDPSHAEAWSNFGVALQEKLQLQPALEAHQSAIRLAPENPQLHYNFAMTLMLSGEFDFGFSEFEHRIKISNLQPREFAGKLWIGEDLSGQTLLVHAEQGVGDTIQFARFLQPLSDAGADILFSTHSSLVELMGTLNASPKISTGHSVSDHYDYQIPLLSLPQRIGRSLTQNEFFSAPYLSVPDGTISPVPSGGACPRIGLVWAGNPLHSNDRNRSCPLEMLSPLFDLGWIDWFSLQVGKRHSDVEATGFPIIDLSNELENFSITAAAIESLDLVISVDTAIIHLAGALGHPAWCLLSHSPDWRWQVETANSPWYPSLRLFRQPSRGDWKTVANQVCEALIAKFKSHAGVHLKN